MNKGWKILIFVLSFSILSSAFGLLLPKFEAQEVPIECTPIEKASIENFPIMYEKYNNFCLSQYEIGSKFYVNGDKFIVKQTEDKFIISNLSERKEWITKGQPTTNLLFKRTINLQKLQSRLAIPLFRNNYNLTGVKPVQKILGYIYKVENNQVYIINADSKIKVCRSAKTTDISSIKNANAFCLGRRIDYSVKNGEQIPAGIGYGETQFRTTPIVSVSCPEFLGSCRVNIEGDSKTYKYGDQVGTGYISGFYIANRAGLQSLGTKNISPITNAPRVEGQDSAIISVVQNTPPCAEYNFNFSIGGDVDTKTCAALNPSNSANWIYYNTTEGKNRLKDTARNEDFKLYVPVTSQGYYEKIDYIHRDPNTGQWENSVIWDGRKFANETGALCTNLFPSWNYDLENPIVSIPPEERACTSSESAGAYRIYEPTPGLLKRFYTYIFIGEETVDGSNYLVFVIFKDRTSNT